MPTFDLELALQRQGFSLVAGIDEVGRGPLAGPVVSAAVILPPMRPESSWLSLVNDSKALTPVQRRNALKQIEDHATGIGLGMATAEEIDSEGIVRATKWSMRRAVGNLATRPSCLLIDFVQLPECGMPFYSLAHGDRLSFSIAAASIVAKVSRDRLMEEMDGAYPGYGFSRHKGYPTPQHLRQLALLGPSPMHRFSFHPVIAALEVRKGGPPVVPNEVRSERIALGGTA